jgi:hypothetical protein
MRVIGEDGQPAWAKAGELMTAEKNVKEKEMMRNMPITFLA